MWLPLCQGLAEGTTVLELPAQAKASWAHIAQPQGPGFCSIDPSEDGGAGCVQVCFRVFSALYQEFSGAGILS